MTRSGKIFAWAAAGVALVLVAAVVVLATLDWNRLKPTINERASEALGRPFAIEGDLTVDWRRAPAGSGWRGLLPWAHVTARDLTVGNPEWAAGPRMAALRQLDFTLSPWPLLDRRIAIPHIELGEPSAELERLEDGRNNWTFGSGVQAGEPSAWRVDIGEIVFKEGRIRADDRQTDTRVELVVDPLGKPIPFDEVVGDKSAKRAVAQDYVFGWKMRGRYRGQNLRGSGKLGGLLALQDPDRPFPLQADVTVGPTRIALAGTLTDPRNLAALDLKLRLSGRSMSELFPLIGVTLPDTPPYATDGLLVARLREPGGAVYRYEDFRGQVGESDLRGSLRYTAGEPRPRLTGTLTSRQLRFADLGPLIGADTAGDGDEDGGRDRDEAAQRPGKALPVQEFRTERWAKMDADVRFTGKRIVRGEALPLDNLDTHLILEGGVLRLEPLRFGMAGGRLDGDIRLDGRATPLTGRAKLDARHFKLKELFPTVEAMQTSLGELNAAVDLAGRGNSVAALLGSADGEARLLMNDGTVSRSLMELAGLNLGNYLVGKLFGDEQVAINCIIADLEVEDGLARPRVFLFDTENAVVHVGGAVNLATEELELDVRAQSKGVRVLSLRSPLYVQGTFKAPEAGVHTGALAARGAGLLALGAAAGPLAGLLALIGPSGGEENQCAVLLRRQRSGAAARP